MSNNQTNMDKFVRLFTGKGKTSVPGETTIDDIVPGEYNPEIETNKTKNEIAKSKNKVWFIGGISSIALIVSLPVLLSIHVWYLSSLIVSEVEESQLVRIEKMYDNAREDRNDLVKIIIPGILTIITVGIFNINRYSEKEEED